MRRFRTVSPGPFVGAVCFVFEVQLHFARLQSRQPCVLWTPTCFRPAGITGIILHELLGVDGLYPTGGLASGAAPPTIF